MRGTAPGLYRLLRIGAVAISMASIGTLTACGSSGPSAAQSASSTTCQQVSAVLSDGPDPGDDPVGYAEAQIGPLRHIHTTDRSLQRALYRLDTAYSLFFSHDGNATARATVSRAATSVDALCPGAGAGT